jgi:hypothetical protein
MSANNCALTFSTCAAQIAGFETSLQPEVQNRALKKILAPSVVLRLVDCAGVSARPAIAFATLVIAAAIIGLFLSNSNKTRDQTDAVASAKPVRLRRLSQLNKAASSNLRKHRPNRKANNNQTKATTKRRAASRQRQRKSCVSQNPVNSLLRSSWSVRSADSQTMTAMHFEKSETLLRAFRNVRLNEPGAAAEVGYERKRAQQLVYQNMMLRREADAAGDVQISSLLESLEPILIDIANLPDKPDEDAVRVIRERVERKNIVPLLRVNSTALARALD